MNPSIFLSGSGSTFFNNVHNSPGTGIGNQIVNDKELVSGLTQALEKLSSVIERIRQS